MGEERPDLADVEVAGMPFAVEVDELADSGDEGGGRGFGMTAVQGRLAS